MTPSAQVESSYRDEVDLRSPCVISVGHVPTNFQTKVKYLKSSCEILKRDYGSDIPETLEDLCKLPGVGPKMAHLCMSIAWNKRSGIGDWY